MLDEWLILALSINVIAFLYNCFMVYSILYRGKDTGFGPTTHIVFIWLHTYLFFMLFFKLTKIGQLM